MYCNRSTYCLLFVATCVATNWDAKSDLVDSAEFFHATSTDSPGTTSGNPRNCPWGKVVCEQEKFSFVLSVDFLRGMRSSRGFFWCFDSLDWISF